jgi:Uma2 family endonuclease
MAGASVNHNQITANILTNLKIQLKGSNCRPFSSDLLVKTGNERYRYPDVVVVCNNQFLDDYSTNSPVFIVEVLSKATRQADRQSKRLEYLQLASLQEYMLIEQDSVEVEVFRRSQGWQPSYYYWGDTIELESIKVMISVEDIYELVANEDVERFLKSNNTNALNLPNT